MSLNVVEELKSSAVRVNDLLAEALVKKLEAEENNRRKRKHAESSTNSEDSDIEEKIARKKRKKKKKHKKHKKKKSKSEKEKLKKAKYSDSAKEAAKHEDKRKQEVSEEQVPAAKESLAESPGITQDSTENGEKEIEISADKVEQPQDAEEESCEEGQIKDSEDEKEEPKDGESDGKHVHKKHKHKKKRRASSRDHKHHDSDSEKHYRSHDYFPISPPHHHHRKRSYSDLRNKLNERYKEKSRSPLEEGENREKINKEELRRIARRNLLEMIETGNLPKGVNMDLIKREWIEDLKSEKKDVNEWTEFCRALSKMEQQGDDDDDSSHQKRLHDSEDEGDTPFIHHPFKLREPQPTIRLNIKNAIQIPIKTPAEKVANAAKLRLQFPVSSGSQHRMKEFEWVPVNEDETAKKSSVKSEISLPSKDAAQNSESDSSQLNDTSLQPFYLPSAAHKAEISYPLLSYPQPNSSMSMYCAATPSDSSVFPTSSNEWDISQIMAQRLHAIRLLQEDPSNTEAQQQAMESQKRMQDWVQSKQQPGMFTGSTNARLLSPEELSGPIPAWTKRDQFSRAHPVREGIGMHLLKKMGWNPGEGLGKNKEGALEPLLPDIKTDKRGLVSGEDLSKKMVHIIAKETPGKHPVSALTELCTKRKWGPPEFHLLDESGPDHRKSFLFKVRVNGIDYQPGVSSTTKKQAKAHAAQVCLQALGIQIR